MENQAVVSQPKHKNGSTRKIRIRIFLESTLGLAILYLLAITIAEFVTVVFDPRLGLVLHGILLIGILFHATLRTHGTQQAFLLSQALAPLVRILSLSLPLKWFPFIFWYALVGIPLFFAALLTARVIGLGRVQIGITAKSLPLQIPIALTGIGLGYIEYHILHPQPMASSLTFQQIWLPALILLIFTGLLEEVIFRGVMYYVALRSLGRLGIIYVAAIFAVLHLGYKSLWDILFIFLVAILFGVLAFRTGSILGVTFAHGLTNIGLFLVFPFILNLPQPPPTNLPDQAIAQYTLAAQLPALQTTQTPQPSASPGVLVPAIATRPTNSNQANPLFNPTATRQSLTPVIADKPLGTLEPTSESNLQIKTFTPTLVYTRTNFDLIIVDDGDPGFTITGGKEFSSSQGYLGDFHWSTISSQNDLVEASWIPAFSTCGLYRLDVFIPSGINLTSSAFYQVGYRKGMSGHLVDQAAHRGEWVTIGTFEFLPSSGSYLRLNNQTSEPAQIRSAIAFDAARWTRQGPCVPVNP